MTIEKGEPWGSTFEGELPALRAIDDADLARLAHENRSHDAPPEILVGPGDVAATIGVETEPLDTEFGDTESGDAGAGDADSVGTRLHRYPMDLGYVGLGKQPGQVERTVPFVGHVLGHRWSSGVGWPELIVMNTPLASGLRLGPKAHPNDGRLDTTVGSLPWRQWGEARRRAVSGTHVPHPRLVTRRVTEAEFTPQHRVRIRVDGVDHGRWSSVSVSIVPDAYQLVARVG